MGRVKRLEKYRKSDLTLPVRIPYTLYKQIWEIGRSKNLTLVDAGRILSRKIEEKKIVEEIKRSNKD